MGTKGLKHVRALCIYVTICKLWATGWIGIGMKENKNLRVRLCHTLDLELVGSERGSTHLEVLEDLDLGGALPDRVLV